MAATRFQIEAWVEYALGMAILLGRIAYRIHVVRWNWHGDDFFTVAALLFLTVRSADISSHFACVADMFDSPREKLPCSR
jgi:hypothetical protein